jgi:hypothetical protein
MPPFLRALEQTFGPLYWSTVCTALLVLPSLLGLLFDTRVLTGANPWLKPIKFEVSIVIFNLTIGWLLLNLDLLPSSAKTISSVVALTMLVEIVAIVLQASRGVSSHYNASTPLNSAIFGAMAIAIVANTLAVTWLAVLSFGAQPRLPPALVWGIRLGILLFLLSSLQGFQMVANNAHTVGARDGGPGLPFLRWSTRAGDLRIAHFIGLHAIQILPLIGYLASRADRQSGTSLVATVFVAMTALLAWTLRQAMMGRPLLR